MACDRMLADAQKHPGIFQWNDPIQPAVLDQWIEEHNIHVPEDLRLLWCLTGGGDIFESETLLGPFADRMLADDVESVNQWYKERGLPDNYLVFCKGAFFSAVRLPDQQYVVLDERTFIETGEFSSLDEWYIETLRAEYGKRYGLL